MLAGKTFVRAYTITLPESTPNGNIAVNKPYVAATDEDKTVTLTVLPDEGYQVKSVKVNDTVITPVDGVYSFTMPAEDVTVSAEFERLRLYTVTASHHVKLYDGNTDVTGQQFPAGTTLTIEPYYTEVIRNVRANGELLTPDENGVYSVTVTDADIAVTADAYRKESNFDDTAYVLWQIGENGEPTDGVFTIYGTGAIGSRDSLRPKIKTVVFDENCKVNEIEFSTFDYCRNLTAVTLGDSVKTIGYNAFRNCSSLRSIDLGSGVTLIGTQDYGNVFYNCTSLDDVYISADPANLTWLDNAEDSEEVPDDFKPDGSTLIHVPDGYLFGYADKFSGKLNAKFVGEHDNIYGETAYEISVPHMTVTGLTDGKAKVGDTITLTPAKGCKVTEVKNGETALVPDESGAYSLRILTEPALTSDAAPIDYAIIYELDGGTNAATNPETYTVEDAVTLADPSRTGYTFKGWTEGSTIASGSTGDKTFTAEWTLNEYSITYVLDGGTNAAENPASYTVESEDITLADPTRTGYTFAGWVDAGGNTVSGIAKGSTGNQKLTATWNANSYKVTLPTNMMLDKTVLDAGKAKFGTEVSFKPMEGFAVIGAVSDGTNTLTAADGVYTFTMGAGDVTISAVTGKFVPAVAATCENDGNIAYYLGSDGKYYADTKGTVLESVIDPKIGHSYGSPSWTWTADYSAASAKFTCGNCKDVQTVKAAITSEKTDATYEADGKITYTATVTFGGKTYTDTKEVTIPKLVKPETTTTSTSTTTTTTTTTTTSSAASSITSPTASSATSTNSTSSKSATTTSTAKPSTTTTTAKQDQTTTTKASITTTAKPVETTTAVESATTSAKSDETTKSSTASSKATTAASSTESTKSTTAASTTVATKATTTASTTEPAKSTTAESTKESAKATTAGSTTESTKATTATSSTESAKVTTVVSTTESAKATTVASTTGSTKATTVASTTEVTKATTAVSTTESTKATTVASTTESAKVTTVASTLESTKTTTALSTTESAKATTAASTTESAKATSTEATTVSMADVTSTEATTTSTSATTVHSDTTAVSETTKQIITATVDPKTNKVEVLINTEDVEGNGGLDVNVDNGMHVTFDDGASDTLRETMKKSGTENITFNISSEPDFSKMTAAEAATVKKAIANSAIVFDFDLYDADSKEPVVFDTNNMGKIAIEFPLSAEQLSVFPNSNLVVVYVDSNGNIEYMDTWFDPEKGVITFTVTHFSTYMIISDDRVKETTPATAESTVTTTVTETTTEAVTTSGSTTETTSGETSESTSGAASESASQTTTTTTVSENVETRALETTTQTNRAYETTTEATSSETTSETTSSEVTSEVTSEATSKATSEETPTTTQTTDTSTTTTATTETKPEGWFASLNSFGDMAKKDYADKHEGVTVDVKTEQTADGNVKVTIVDNEGEVLDVYMIDPKTGTGTNQNAEAVNLPQTGTTSKSTAAAVGGALAMIAAGFWTAVRSLRKKKDE